MQRIGRTRAERELPHRHKVSRNSRGNMIVLILAVTMGLVMALLFFCLKYTRMLGADQEQRTAVEAAALAGANDLSRIVIEDPVFGFVSLGDYAPVASNTKASDGESLPVRSFNSLLATVRSEMIISDAIGDANMKTLAANDYDELMKSKDFLVTQLDSAANGGTGFKDVDGNNVDMRKDIIDAYEGNIIRMTGAPSQLDRTSLRITLGALTTPLPTWTPVPQPSSFSNVSSGQMWYPSDPQSGTQINPCYMSLVNQPYNGKDFVFAAVGQNIQLVDHKKFVATLPALPYLVPSVVKVECDQVYADADMKGNASSHRVHAVACAEPGSAVDPRPAPGALKITFVDGTIGELGKPGDLLTNPQLKSNPIELYTPDPGDYPGTALIPISPPILGSNPPLASGWGRGLIDWIRRAGPKANVAAVVSMQNTGFNTGGIAATTPRTNVYEWNEDGTIKYAVLQDDPTRKLAGSNRQGYGMGDSTFNSSVTGSAYDVLYTDTVAIAGRLGGGLHGGEPLNDISLTAPALTSAVTIASNDEPNKPVYLAWMLALTLPLAGMIFGGRRSRRIQAVLGLTLLLGTSASVLTACAGYTPPPRQKLTSAVVGPRIPRTTYTNNGLAVEVEFRKH